MKKLAMLLLLTQFAGAKNFDLQVKITGKGTATIPGRSKIDSRCIGATEEWQKAYCQASGGIEGGSDDVFVVSAETSTRTYSLECNKLRRHLPELGTTVPARVEKRFMELLVDGKTYKCRISEEKLRP